MTKYMLGVTFALSLVTGVALAESTISTESKTTTADPASGDYSSTTKKESVDSHGNSIEVERSHERDGDESESSTSVTTESPSGASTSYEMKKESSPEGSSVTIEKETDTDD